MEKIIACLGVVATVLFQFIPWAFGWVDTINVNCWNTCCDYIFRLNLLAYPIFDRTQVNEGDAKACFHSGNHMGNRNVLNVNGTAHFRATWRTKTNCLFRLHGPSFQLAWFDGILSSHVTMAVGGTILFLSAMLLVFFVVQALCVLPKAYTEKDVTEFPITESDIENTPKFLENWTLWIGITFILIAIAYFIPLSDLIQHVPPGSKGFQLGREMMICLLR